jgi:hypothetical protein
MLRVFELYFLFKVMATSDYRRIENIEKELAVDGIICILNDEGIYIPPIKKNKIMNDNINDINFTSYSNNLSCINTVHEKLEEDLINCVLNLSDKGYSNTKKEYLSEPNVDSDLNNITLHSEYDEFRKHIEFHDFKNFMPNSDITSTTSAYQLQTKKNVKKKNDMTVRLNRDIDTSEHTYSTKKFKLEKTTKILITPSR